MDLARAVAMGIIQGLTEFLPVSSSGHLTLYHLIYGGDLPSALNMVLEIILHAGTLLAVLVVYFPRLWDMVRHPIQSDLKWLVVATLPAVAGGAAVQGFYRGRVRRTVSWA